MIWVALILIIILLALTSKKQYTQSEMDKIVEIVLKDYMNYAFKYDGNNFSVNRFVNWLDILAIICQESGGALLKGLKNDQIIGDDGRSFGVMQVSKPALIDVNKRLRTGYTVEDLLKSVDTNILVGSVYYQICIEEALRRKDEFKGQDPKFVGLRFYNGGFGQVKPNNNISVDYANNVLKFKEIIKQKVKF